MSNVQTKTTEKLKKLEADMVVRALGFSQQRGLFSGQLIDEELTFWIEKLRDAIYGD